MSVFLLVFLLGAGSVALIALLVRRRSPETMPPPGALLDVRHHTGRWRWGGVAAGLAVAAASMQMSDLGRGPMLAVPLFGLCVLIGVVIGESLVRPPGGSTRSAAMEVRRVRDYLPRRLTYLVGSTSSALLTLLALTTATASPDDLGRAGRSLAHRCGAEVTGSSGPWPGSFYSLPLAFVVTVGFLTAYLSLRAIVNRPRSGPDAATMSVDNALRHRAANAVVGACGILVALPMVGILLTTARPLLSSPCPTAWWSVVGWGLLLLVPAVLALAGWCAAVVLAPGATQTPTSPQTPQSVA